MPELQPAPTTRRCWVCHTEKPLEEFHRDRGDRLGRQKSCKVCTNTRNSVYQARHREYFKQRGKDKYDRSQNPARYRRYRGNYLRRRAAERTVPECRLHELLASTRDRARRTGLEFSLTVEWLLERYRAQDGRCALTGITLTFERNPYGERFYMPFSPSLDRIDSDGGYTVENTRLVCVVVNLALNRFGEGVLQQVCEGYLRGLAQRPRGGDTSRGHQGGRP